MDPSMVLIVRFMCSHPMRNLRDRSTQTFENVIRAVLMSFYVYPTCALWPVSVYCLGIMKSHKALSVNTSKRGILDVDLAVVDFLGSLVNGGEVVEGDEGHLLILAVGDEVCQTSVYYPRSAFQRGSQVRTLAGLGEQQVRLTGGGKVRDTVTGVEHDGLAGEAAVLANLDALVVTVLSVIAVAESPAALLVDLLALASSDVVADDLNVVGLVAEPHLEEAANDGLHAATQDDDGDVAGLAPLEEVKEAGVELDVGAEMLDALVEGGGDGVHHLHKGLAVGAAAPENVVVALEAALDTEAEVLRHPVIGILESDGTVKVGEEDELGVGGESRGIRGNGAHVDCKGSDVAGSMGEM